MAHHPLAWRDRPLTQRTTPPNDLTELASVIYGLLHDKKSKLEWKYFGLRPCLTHRCPILSESPVLICGVSRFIRSGTIPDILQLAKALADHPPFGNNCRNLVNFEKIREKVKQFSNERS